MLSAERIYKCRKEKSSCQRLTGERTEVVTQGTAGVTVWTAAGRPRQRTGRLGGRIALLDRRQAGPEARVFRLECSRTATVARLPGGRAAKETRCSQRNVLRGKRYRKDVRNKAARQEEGARGCGRRQRGSPEPEGASPRAPANPNMVPCACTSLLFTLSYRQ